VSERSERTYQRSSVARSFAERSEVGIVSERSERTYQRSSVARSFAERSEVGE
jgi:hypothetical protein